MKIHLESNFKLLGSEAIESIGLDVPEITVKDLLHIMSERSTKSPVYLSPDGTDVDAGWQIRLNGRMLDLYEKGINTVVKDGDTVAILMNWLEGCCGGSLQR